MSSDGSTVVLFRAIPNSFRFSASEKRALTDFARSLSVRVAAGRSFICLLSNDRKLRQLNRFFLGRDYATDVLSFPNHGSTEQLGELAISVERAQAQAGGYGHSLLDELKILMLHGVLHLAGFDHDRDRGEMARAESKWRHAYALPLTLIARAAANSRLRLSAAASWRHAFRDGARS